MEFHVSKSRCCYPCSKTRHHQKYPTHPNRAFFYSTWNTSVSFLSGSHQANGPGAYYTVGAASTFYGAVCQSFLKIPAFLLLLCGKVGPRGKASRKWGVHMNPGCTGRGSYKPSLPRGAQNRPPEPPASTESISAHPSCSRHQSHHDDCTVYLLVPEHW